MIVNVSNQNGVNRAVAQLANADSGLAVAMMDAARERLGAEWHSQMAQRVANEQERRMIVEGSSTLVGADGIILKAAQSVIPLSGGLVPYTNWPGVEFGARTRRATFLTHSRKGTPYMVTKMINRGLPSRQQFGRIAFDAASVAITQLVGAWVDTLEEVYNEAVDNDG